jgi:hypothetical protein
MAFSTDFLAASIIFLFTLGFVLVYHMEAGIWIAEKEAERDHYNEAITALNNLLASPGEPPNWERLSSLDQVKSIGLVSTRNVLDSNKLQKLVDLNSTQYQTLKTLAGVVRNDLELTVRNMDGTALYQFGITPSSDKQIAKVRRIARLNNIYVIVEAKVFR